MITNKETTEQTGTQMTTQATKATSTTAANIQMSIPPEVQSNGGRRLQNLAAKVVRDTESLYRGTSLKEGNGADNRYPFDEYKDTTGG